MAVTENVILSPVALVCAPKLPLTPGATVPVVAVALSARWSKVARNGVVPTPPPPILQPVIWAGAKPPVQPVIGICTVVSEPTANAARLTEKICVLRFPSSNWIAKVVAALPASRWAVTVTKFSPVALRVRPVAPQPLSSRAVPPTVRVAALGVTLPTQVVPERTEPVAEPALNESSKIVCAAPTPEDIPTASRVTARYHRKCGRKRDITGRVLSGAGTGGDRRRRRGQRGRRARRTCRVRDSRRR